MFLTNITYGNIKKIQNSLCLQIFRIDFQNSTAYEKKIYFWKGGHFAVCRACIIKGIV